MTMEEAAKIGDIFVTTTGNTSIITEKHFKVMKNGAILSNAGHFNVEIDLEWLHANKEGYEVRDSIETFVVNGKKINVLAEGRLVNLATTKGMGHPIEVMDLSFALQALCSEYILREGSGLKGDVYDVPNEIDIEVASLKLGSLGIDIDALTDEQDKYMNSWDIGT
jgi:adenosylhomocysteinase